MLHSHVLPIDNHPFYTWRYSTRTALEQELGFVQSDLGKIAWILDTNTFLVLVAIATNIEPPTWIALMAQELNGDNVSVTADQRNMLVDATFYGDPETLVLRDAQGNFAANRITATIVGNSGSASVLQTARTITLDGDVNGTATFDGSSDITITSLIQPNSVELGADTTGSYVATITAGTGVTITGSGAENATPTISIGQPVAATDSPTFQNLTVNGNITILGTTSTINSTNLNVQDPIIQLASGNVAGGIPFIGLQAVRGTGSDSFWMWDEQRLSWRSALQSGIAYVDADVTADTVYATSFVGALAGPVTGNASTASQLQTARTISLAGDVTGSVSFDGSNNVTITTTIEPNSVALGTDTTGSYVAAGNVSGNGLSGGVNTAGSTFIVTSNATQIATPSTIVFRDASGSFAANYITASSVTASLVGNASTATTLETARTLSITGDAGWSVSFDGSNSVSGVLTLTNTGVTPGSYGSATSVPVVTVDGKGRISALSTVGITPAWSSITGAPTTLAGYGITDSQTQSAELTAFAGVGATGLLARTGTNTYAARTIVVTGNGITIANADGIAGNPVINLSSTATAAASTLVFRDSAGSFVANVVSATTFMGALTGNASTATTLQTARNINGVPFNGSADVAVTAAAGTLTGATLSSGVTASSLTSVGTLTGLTVTAPISGSLAGNASTATTLQTARTINGVAFDGSANITVTAAAGTLTGATLSSGVTASSLTSVGTLTGLTVTAPISGSLAGNASTATTLQTSRTINGVMFNGSANITVTAAAGTLTGATLSSGVTASSLTSVGTLTGLTVSGDPTFSSTGYVKLPSGTTAQRPAGTAAQMRFNTSTSQFEGHNGTVWGAIGGGTTVSATAPASPAIGATWYDSNLTGRTYVWTGVEWVDASPGGVAPAITSSDVTTALGFTPYDATNPSGYVTAAGSVANATNVAITNDVATATAQYVTFTSATTGNLPVKTSLGKLTFTPSTGDLVAGGDITAFSDSRLKTDLAPIKHAMDRVKQLTGYTYTRTDTGAKQVGLIAQDVIKVLPEAVNDSGEYLSLAYGNMVALLVEAIKDLDSRLARLEQAENDNDN